MEEFLEKLASGGIQTKIKTQKQNEHVLGTTERDRRIQKDLSTGKTPSSYFYEGVNVDRLIQSNIGKGEIVFLPNQQYPTEYVSLGENIGRVYNVGEARYVDVSRIAIKYSRRGTHAYLVKDW